MKKTMPLFLSLLFSMKVYAISDADALRIADKIWKNECSGKLEHLTHWGEGEGFGSFGIGHFIWYSEGKEERFEETFPLLLDFLIKNKAKVPSWLEKKTKSPWGSREIFYQKINSPEMISLRQMLFDTRGLQALFIVKRFEDALQTLTIGLPLQQKQEVLEKISALVKTAEGLYAVVDYLNFKGSGLSENEKYKGQGWGLLQVLISMKSTSMEDFVRLAKGILENRVKNAPRERNEERWLKGWTNRIETYLRAE